MKLFLRAAMCGVVLVTAGCVDMREPVPFMVRLASRDDGCSITVGEREVAQDQLLPLARSESKRRSSAIVRSAPAVPYRCFGGVIFTLQQAGFKTVCFAADDRSAPSC